MWESFVFIVRLKFEMGWQAGKL